MPPTDHSEPDSHATPRAADVDLLARCLALSTNMADLTPLRMLLWSDARAWDRAVRLRRQLRLTSALTFRIKERVLAPPAARAPTPGMATPAEILAKQESFHTERRAAQRVALGALVKLLNGAGYEPILMKGARSLWLGVEPWRSMRDFDLLLPGDAARDANALLKREGYAPAPGAVERPNRHHFDLLFRDDLPGWVEIHRRAGNPYAEQFLRTRELAARCETLRGPDGVVRIMTASDHLWHGLVHHHFGHSGYARGTIDLKGLFEFAVGFGALTERERANLLVLAARDGAALAAFDIWIAAAADLLAMPLPAGLAVAPDAAAVWTAMKERRDNPARFKYPGYGDILSLGLAGPRLARLKPKPGRLAIAARLGVVARLMPKIRRD